MKIEKSVVVRTFDEVEDGEVFRVEGGESIFLRIEADGIYTHRNGHDGLAVNLETGAVTYLDDEEKVIIMSNAKVVF